MGRYNFDKCADRRQSDAIKYCELKQRFGRSDLLPAWIADMDFDVCPEITQTLASRVNHPIYGYATVAQSYIDSILGWLDHRHGFKATAEEMTYMPGVVKGIGFAVNFFTSPGDKIVIQPPVYHPFKMVIEGNGRVVINNPLINDGDNYRMDIDGLREIIRTEHPKMFILCNPHNPIGLQWSEETLQEVASVCAEWGVTVVSDEIHGDLMLDGRHHTPFLSVSDDARKVGIMLGAPSKTFNIPGLVSSWCIIKNPELRKPFFDWMTYNEFNEPTFFATEGTEAAYRYGEEWLEEALAYISANISHITAKCELLFGNAIKAIRPQASFLVWLDCKGLGLNQEELVDFFVNHAHLALNDGSMFGKEGEGYMRFNAAAPRATIDHALNSLAEAYNTLKK